MTSSHLAFQEEIFSELPTMNRLLVEWASVNSGSENEAGLAKMLGLVEQAFSELPVEVERVLCQGQIGPEIEGKFPRYALRVKPKNCESSEKPILLNGHYDTVYGANHSFQEVDLLAAGKMRGPGVTDMKGGLVVMLTTLKILESSELSGKVSWEVLITPDEEIGSGASDPLLRDAAARCRFGLIYESAYDDGGFVRTRKGSAIYTVEARGEPAHVGRNYEEGRNAILGLGQLCASIQSVANDLGLIANVGRFQSDSPLNVVPDYATCAWNVRAIQSGDFSAIERALDVLTKEENSGFAEGVEFSWSGGVKRPPKVVDEETQKLYDAVEKIALEVGLPVLWRDTGGGSDGSNLAAYGLPNIDNLGVRGGAIHSDQEYITLDSLSERVGLSLGILAAVAEGNFYE